MSHALWRKRRRVMFAQTKTLADEIVTHTIDLDAAEESRRLMFNFEKNRRIEEYGIITNQRGANR